MSVVTVGEPLLYENVMVMLGKIVTCVGASICRCKQQVLRLCLTRLVTGIHVFHPGKHSLKKLLLRASCKCATHVQPVCKNAVYRPGCQQSDLHCWHSEQA